MELSIFHLSTSIIRKKKTYDENIMTFSLQIPPVFDMILFLYSTFITSAIAVSPDDCFMINKRFLPHTVSDEILKHHCERLMLSAFKRKWTSYLSRALVLNDVVPFTVLTEDPFIDLDRRSLFLDYLEYIADTSSCSTVECISLELNRKIWNVRSPPIVFESAPPNRLNSYSINETWNRGNGSCTSMSVFLITGLRLLGVPARIAGVPHWNLGEDKCPHGDASEACGNHNWVEVFVPNKGWSFLDQRRPDQIVLPLNHSWFFP